MRGIIAAALLLLVAPLAQAAPNVVLIITDDQGYPDLSCNGNPYLNTPNIDRIKAEGVSLERFYVSPVCSPTRASLMTGRYNYRTGVVDTYLGRSRMFASETTLAERLHTGGYRNGIFGKWHLGDTWPLRAMDQGFDESLVSRGGGVGQASDPPGNTYFNPRLQHNGVEEATSGFCTDVFTEAAIEFIRTNKDKPFFTFVTYNAPHKPLTVEERYSKPFIEQGLDEDTAGVYGMVVNIDENVGRILAALSELGIEKDTLVIFMTDNGAQYDKDSKRFTAGMRGQKSTPYEGGIRVPCYLRWPGTLEAGRVVNDVVAHIDLSPTLLEALKVPVAPEAALDGRSVWPLLTGKESTLPARPIFLQWHRGDEPRAFENCAVVEQQYKLVNGAELYDIPADPGETSDLAGQRPEDVARMRALYEAWFADVSATRGYAPPRLVLAPPEAPHTVLTPQDWRGTGKFGPSDYAYWDVATTEGGPLDIRLDFNKPLHGVRVAIEMAGQRREAAVPDGAESYTFEDVNLPAHAEDRLAFHLYDGGKDEGVGYVHVTR